MTDPFLYVVAGLFVGAMVGLTGVGGGSLMTPILVLIFGQSPVVAVGTDLVFSATTKLVATASFGTGALRGVRPTVIEDELALAVALQVQRAGTEQSPGLRGHARQFGHQLDIA